MELLKGNILKPHFAFPEPRVIGTGTLSGFLKHYFTGKYKEVVLSVFLSKKVIF